MNYDNYLDIIKDKRQNILDGKINCIPHSFERFSAFFPGIEKGQYTIVTANQKVGKSKFVDNLFVYDPFFYSISNPDKIRLHIFYYSLEMTEQAKFFEFICHLLWKRDKIICSPQVLRSVNKSKLIPDEVFELINSNVYKRYYELFFNTVIYSMERNPLSIYTEVTNYFKENLGNVIYNNKGTIDKCVYNDEKDYMIVIIDNFSNLAISGSNNKKQLIDDTSKYCMQLRDLYNAHVVVVQHQSQAQEGIENRKLKQLEPSSDGLGDSKATTRDINYLFGLFSPYKHDISKFPDVPSEAYDITKFKNNIRFLKILEGREGGGGTRIPLFFNGASSVFEELPQYPSENPQKIEECMKIIQKINEFNKK